jgi:hypothetical protein
MKSVANKMQHTIAKLMLFDLEARVIRALIDD